MIQAKDLLAAFSGVLLVGAFSPFSLSSLTLLAPALLLAACNGASPARASLRGCLFGLGLFGAGVHWLYYSLHDFGGATPLFAVLATVALVFYLSLFPAFLGWSLQWLAPGPGFLRYLVVFPALWIVMEWLRERLLTGFPWLGLGYGQIDGPWAGWLPVVGVLGVGGLLALGAGCLACIVQGPTRHRAVGACLLALTLGAGMLLAQHRWTAEVGDPLQVLLVQGNISQDKKWLPEQRLATLDQYRDMTLEAPPKDIVVWPETAVPALRFQVLPWLDSVARDIGERGGELIYGVATYDRKGGGIYNSIGVAGNPGQLYHKRHLVPFGEYLPLRQVFEFFRDHVQIPMADFSTGRPDQVTLDVGGMQIGASICYEAAFAEEIRSSLPGAELLVNVTNDAWFGESPAPYQHLDIARVRSAETGRAMLRATNTGISAVIDHRGRVLARTGQFETAVLEAQVSRRSGSTPFVSFGQAPILAVALLALVLAMLVRRRRGRAEVAATPARRMPA